MTLAAITVNLFLTLFLILFYRAFRFLLNDRMKPAEKPDPNLYGITNLEEYIEAKFFMRKDGALIFEKDGALFGISVDLGSINHKFKKGKVYKIKKEESGLITILFDK